MEKKHFSRRSSSESIAAIGVDGNKKKKSPMNFLNVFSKRSDESGKASGTFMSYLKNRKNSGSKQNNMDKVVGSVESEKEVNNKTRKRFSYNTWSLRQTSRSEPSLADNGARVRQLDAPLTQTNQEFQPAASVPPSPGIPNATPTAFVNLFTPPASSAERDLDRKFLPCGTSRMNSPADDYIDCDVISTSSDDRILSRQCSIKSQSSINLFPPSPARPATIGEPLARRSLLNPSTSPKLILKKRSPSESSDLARNLFSRLTGSGWGEGRNKRVLCDVAEEVFDTWDGRNAMTLPRHINKGESCFHQFIKLTALQLFFNIILQLISNIQNFIFFEFL